jgi:hypothetical protein
MLLLMLGAVLVLMRQMEQPETVAYLDRVFAPAATQDPPIRPPRRELPGERASVHAAAEAAPPLAGKITPREDGPWAAVQDNAMFLDAEHEAWFLLWAEAKRLSPAQLDRQAIAEVSYAQLVNQPEVYRGQAVRVRGRILRESVKQAPENDIGMSEYHQLVLAPVGGGDWSVIVYCLELPPGFPRGGGLKEDVAITALFFKNWSSPDGEGMGLFPVLMARTFQWRPPASLPAVRKNDETDRARVALAAVAASFAAMAVVVWVARQTRRQRTAGDAAPDFQRLSAET